MTQQINVHKLLVLRGPTLAGNGVIEFLHSVFDVHQVADMEQALDAMREHRFAAVLAETADFLPLERGVVTQQASVVLDTIGDGVGIAGPAGQLVWANRRLREYPQPVLDELRKVCLEAFGHFSTQRTPSGERGRRFSILPSDGSYFEVICSPVRDRQDVLQQVAAVVVNATSQRRAQLKLNAIDRAGRELVRLDDDALRKGDAQQRLRVLEDRIIRCSRDVLDYQHFEVLALDGRSNRLETLISEGLDDHKPCELFATTEGNGICGYVAATGRSYIAYDTQRDSRYVVGYTKARSSLTVPLRLHDKIVGVLNVESERTGAFGEEDRQFAEIFGHYVAMALHILNLLIYERHETTTQVSGSISAELAGPLNDIITQAGELMEDYIGHDDLRKRLGGIIDQATSARKALQLMADAPRTGMLNAPCSGPVQPDAILNGKRVLVADDEDLIRQTISDVLRAYCHVDAASNGQEAKEMLAAGKYDLVLSDIKMPGATGYEVFAAAKSLCPQTQVILMTGFGYDPNHSIVKANREGLSAVLMKPFKVKQLLDECRAALTTKRR